MTIYTKEYSDNSHAQENLIGTQYMTKGKHPRLCTVVDKLITTRSDGTLYKTRYIATHEFLGQTVHDYDVVRTTIIMGLTH